MSWEKVKRRARATSGTSRSIELFSSSLEHEAVAAASIGQVHRGVLADGREVAVKVQYPEIADALESDLDLASVLIGLGKAIAPGLDPKLVAGELRERVLEELDFELEAQQQRTFARAYRGHPFVYVPDVVTCAVAPPGARHRVGRRACASRRSWRLDQARARPRRARSSCASSSARWPRVGRFNTDPHPGNYLLLRRWADGVPGLRQHGRGRATGSDAPGALMAAVEGDADGFTERRRRARLRARSATRRPRAAARAGAARSATGTCRTASCGSIPTTSRA